MKDSQTKAMKQAINAKQAPRRCESVDYIAKLYDENGIKLRIAESEVEHGDIWLDKLFNK